MTWISRHESFVARSNLRVRQQDGIADIFLVTSDNLPALQRDRFAVEPFKPRRTNLRAPHVTATAAEFAKEPLATLDERALRSSRSQPFFIFGGRHHDDLPDHPRLR